MFLEVGSIWGYFNKAYILILILNYSLNFSVINELYSIQLKKHLESPHLLHQCVYNNFMLINIPMLFSIWCEISTAVIIKLMYIPESLRGDIFSKIALFIVTSMEFVLIKNWFQL